MIHSNNIKEIWKNSINEIFSNGYITDKCQDEYSIGSYFGNEQRFTKETLGTTIILSNPRNRILSSNIRKLNYGYLLANFLFLFHTENKIDFIKFYNSKGRLFTDNNKTLNAPLGYRINRFNQLEKAIDLIKRDISTRRAVIQIYKQEDLGKLSRDIPCINYFQLLIRNSKLYFITNMRSQSVFSILPYDIFLFSLFQEAIACQLNLDLGDYMHFSGSFHIYNDEFKKSLEVINYSEPVSFEMIKMKSFDNKIIQELLKAEKEIREKINIHQENSIDFAKYSLDEYWQNFLKAMFYSYLYPEEQINNMKDIIKTQSLAYSESY